MGARERVAFDDARNAGILRWLAGRERLPGTVASAPRGTVDEYELGAHPDLVQQLWDVLDAALPKRCAWIVHGRAALVSPDSGILFGLALGTTGVVLRIPPEREPELGVEARHKRRRYENGSELDLGPCGPEWALAPYGKQGERWCQAAYDGAA